MNRDSRIVAGDSTRPDLGRWYAHLRPASGYRRMAAMLGPLFLLIEVVGWFLTLKAAFLPPRDFKGVCFGIIFLTPLAIVGALFYFDEAAARRYVYTGGGALRMRSEVWRFRRDHQIVALDRIRSLDYGGIDNLKIRGLMVGYVVQKEYLQFAMLGDLDESETMQVIALLRGEVSPEVNSAVRHGARYGKPGLLRRSEAFVIQPGFPVPEP